MTSLTHGSTIWPTAHNTPNLCAGDVKMQRFHSASFLFVALVLGSASLQAKEKVRVEVVEAASYSYLDTGVRTIPATPEQTITDCSGISGIYARDYGYNCVSTKNPATPERTVLWPTALGAYAMAKVIMPNGAHVILICTIGEKHCARFVDKKATGIEEDCADLTAGIQGEMRIFCRYTNRGSGSLGQFDAQIDGDRVIISGPNGKREYRKSGTWGSPDTSPPAN